MGRTIMDDGDGMMTVELQAKKIADNLTRYNGSSPCPTCGMIMNPVEFMANRGHCTPCTAQRNASRVRKGMA